MKVFRCDHCRHLVFFENFQCVSCGHALAYLPDLGVIGSLDSAGNDLWTTPIHRAENRTYRLCEHYLTHQTCNWAVPADDPHTLCISCRLTRVIPNLETTGHKEAWYALECAKRRLIYTLIGLNLSLLNKTEDPAGGLAFEFKADDGDPVLTGHADGVITINVAEADDAEREKRRVELHEPYRTVLGHFRHEIGHYYWDRLIRSDSASLMGFRELFGDERTDYGSALQAHYRNGPPPEWQDRFISGYAAAHPWEDWAESWAHHLHMIDTLDTAASCGLGLQSKKLGKPMVATVDGTPFESLIGQWFDVTYVLNNLNRGLGLRDAYPFVLSAPVIEKLQFIYDVIVRQARDQVSQAVDP